MKQGGNRQKSRGFTMVEVLIVLAVTSAMLVMASVIISGRVAKTEFSVGSRQIRQDIEDVFNQAGSGFSGSQSNFRCSGNISGQPLLSAVSSESGTNASCVFVGKVMIFGTNAARVSSMRVIPLAGNRQTQIGGQLQNITSVTQARPIAIAPSSIASGVPDQSEKIELPRGFEFAGSWISGAAGLQPKIAVAILSDLQGGEAQHFSVYTIDSWAPGNSEVDEADAVNGATSPTSSDYTTHDEVHLCFAHSGTSQSSELVLGRNGGSGIETAIHQGATCSQ